MLKYKTLLKLFSGIYKYDYIPKSRLMMYRKVNSDWLNSIDNNYTSFRIFHQTYSLILENLRYDINEYDSQAYTRMILKKSIVDNSKEYWGIKIPYIDVIPTDLGDQYVVEKREMPDEYYLLMQIYEQYPSTMVTMYPIDMMQSIFKEQYKWLEDNVFSMKDDSDIDNILLFTPICYSVFNQNNTQYTLVMCYVNVIDSFLEQEFPFDYERYYTLKLENINHLDSLSSHLKSLTRRILSGEETMLIPKNIATQLGSFDSSFEELLNQQKYNI